MNILLVDDERDLLALVKAQLRSAGHKVFDAVHAQEALALGQRNQIDLLITDVFLEHSGDGISLARQILSKHPGIPILFISGGVADVKSERPPFPNCAFLSKPFEKSDLMDAITKLTGD